MTTSLPKIIKDKDMIGNRATKISFLPWFICGLGAVFYCYEYFLRISPSVMTTDLMRAYQLHAYDLGNLSAYYYWAYVPMQIIVGLMMDRYGPRRLLTVACIVCAIGTFLFAGSFGLGMAKLGRFLVGFGSAFAFVGSLKLATIWLPPNRFALVSGIILCLGMLGAMIGNVLLQTLVEAIGWQSTIYASCLLGIVLTFVLWVFIRDNNPNVTSQQTHFINFDVLFAGLWQALRNPQIWLNGAVGCLLYVSLSAFAELWGISFLSRTQNLSEQMATYANSMIFLGWAIGGPFWGWFSDFVGRRCLPITVGAAGAAIMGFALIYVINIPVPILFVVLFLFGFLSSAQVLVFAICHEASHRKMAGTAIAFTNMIVMLGGMIFQPVIGQLLDLGWGHVMLNGARVYPISAYQLALSVIPVSIILAFVITFFIKETHNSVKIANHPHH